MITRADYLTATATLLDALGLDLPVANVTSVDLQPDTARVYYLAEGEERVARVRIGS